MVPTIRNEIQVELFSPQQVYTPRQRLFEIRNSVRVVKKLKMNIDEVEVEKFRVEEEGKMQVD